MNIGNRIALSIVLVCGMTISPTLCADRVEGTVTPVPDNREFRILDREEKVIRVVKVDDGGKFRVFLPPGLYRALSKDGKTTIRSESIPMLDQHLIFR